jgi:hypothetical protein
MVKCWVVQYGKLGEILGCSIWKIIRSLIRVMTVERKKSTYFKRVISDIIPKDLRSWLAQLGTQDGIRPTDLRHKIS